MQPVHSVQPPLQLSGRVTGPGLTPAVGRPLGPLDDAVLLGAARVVPVEPDPQADQPGDERGEEDRPPRAEAERPPPVQEAGKADAPQGRDIYIAWMGERALSTAIRVAQIMRQAGLCVELPPVEQKLGKALGQADKLGSRYALILGEDEVTSGQWTLKTLADGQQQKFTEPQVLDFLRRKNS